MATNAETLEKVRELSPGMAEWIDAQRAAGWSDRAICMLLQEAAELAVTMHRRQRKPDAA